jgi:hypothetical protein
MHYNYGTGKTSTNERSTSMKRAFINAAFAISVSSLAIGQERILEQDQATAIINSHGFHNCGNANQGAQNEFEVKGEVIEDRRYGLMWQKSGSDKKMTFHQAQMYVANLGAFAGYTGWRLPTLEEAMTLMKRTTGVANWHIDLKFDNKQTTMFTQDYAPDPYEKEYGKRPHVWMLGFVEGCLTRAWVDAPDPENGAHVRAVRSTSDGNCRLRINPENECKVNALTGGFTMLNHVVTKEGSIKLGFKSYGLNFGGNSRNYLYEFMAYKETKSSDGKLQSRCGAGVRVIVRVTKMGGDISTLEKAVAAIKIGKAKATYELRTIGISEGPVLNLFPNNPGGEYTEEVHRNLYYSADRIKIALCSPWTLITPEYIYNDKWK